MLSEIEINEKIKVIRKAFAEYPKNDATVDEMIAQGLRTGFVLGQRKPKASMTFRKKNER